MIGTDGNTPIIIYTFSSIKFASWQPGCSFPGSPCPVRAYSLQSPCFPVLSSATYTSSQLITRNYKKPLETTMCGQIPSVILLLMIGFISKIKMQSRNSSRGSNDGAWYKSQRCMIKWHRRNTLPFLLVMDSGFPADASCRSNRIIRKN